MRTTRVCGSRGIACVKGFPTHRRGEQEEGRLDHCRLGHCSFLGSLCPRWGARRNRRKNSWIFLLCFCYLFGKGEVKGWYNSNLQLLEGELQGYWNQTLASSGKQCKQERWPQTGVEDWNWTIEETLQKIVPYFPSSYHHYSLWHMEMWEKCWCAVWDPLPQGFIDFGVFLCSATP